MALEAFYCTVVKQIWILLLLAFCCSELEEALLVLPFSCVTRLLQVLNIFIENSWEVELSCRCLFFLLRFVNQRIKSNRKWLKFNWLSVYMHEEYMFMYIYIHMYVLVHVMYIYMPTTSLQYNLCIIWISESIKVRLLPTRFFSHYLIPCEQTQLAKSMILG